MARQAISTLVADHEYGSYKNTTASVLIETGPGTLQGVVINSFTATATIKFWDNTSAATTVIFNTITPATGERWIPFWGAKFTTGLFLTITGTIDVTVIYN